MKRKELAREVARTRQVPEAAARDRVDEVVHDILTRLRAGVPVDLTQLERSTQAGRKLKARPAGGK